jgi:hypothetical protein
LSLASTSRFLAGPNAGFEREGTYGFSQICRRSGVGDRDLVATAAVFAQSN